MEGGKNLMDELKKDRPGGMPWMVILAADGKEIVSSVGPDGNIGCPVQPNEIAHFVDMVKQSSSANDDQLAKIEDALSANARKILGN